MSASLLLTVVQRATVSTNLSVIPSLSSSNYFSFRLLRFYLYFFCVVAFCSFVIQAQVSTLSMTTTQLSKYSCSALGASYYSQPSLVFPEYYPTAYLSTQTLSSSPFSGTFTLIFWLNIARTGQATAMTIVQSGSTSSSASAGQVMNITWNNADYMVFGIGGGKTCTTTAQYTNDLNQWVLWAFTYSGSGSSYNQAIYRNGVQVCLSAASSTVMSLTSSPIVIGNQISSYSTIPSWSLSTMKQSGVLNFFPGYIADFRIYSRVLSTIEMQTVYKSGIHTSNQGLVLYYSFVEQNGTIVYDRSTNGRHAFFSNVTTVMQQQPQWSGYALQPLCLMSPSLLQVAVPSTSPSCQPMGANFTVTVSAIDIGGAVISLYSGQTVGLVATGNSAVTVTPATATLTNGVASFTVSSSVAQNIILTSVDTSDTLLRTTNISIAVQGIAGVYFMNSTAVAAIVGASSTITLYAGACSGAVIVTGSAATAVVSFNSTTLSYPSSQTITLSSSTGMGSFTLSTNIAQVVNFSIASASGGSTKLIVGPILLAYWSSASLYSVNIQAPTFSGLLPSTANTYYTAFPITVPIYAADAGNRPVTSVLSFSVTLVMISSGNLGTRTQVVTITNGVGYAAVSDNVPENLVLSLLDSASTGFTMGTNRSVTFVAGPATSLAFVTPNMTTFSIKTGVTSAPNAVQIQAFDSYYNLVTSLSSTVQVVSSNTSTKLNGQTSMQTISLISGQGSFTFYDGQNVAATVPVYLSMVDVANLGINMTNILVVLVSGSTYAACGSGFMASGTLNFGCKSASLLQNTGDLINMGLNDIAISTWVYDTHDTYNFIFSQSSFPAAYYETTSQVWSTLYVGPDYVYDYVPWDTSASFNYPYSIDFGMGFSTTGEYNNLFSASYPDMMNTWTHWAFSFDSTTLTQKIWYNGDLVAMGTAASWSTLGPVVGSFQLGMAPIIYGELSQIDLACLILDDIRIYTRAFQDYEPLQMAQYNRYANNASLYMHYTFDEMAGQVAHDSGGNFFDVPSYRAFAGVDPVWTSYAPNCLPTTAAIIIQGPLVSKLGSNMLVMLQAIDKYNNNSTSFNGQVQIIITGSTTATVNQSGIVQMSAGVGSIKISDTIPDNFTVSLNDTDLTGVIMSSTQQASFFAGPFAQVAFISSFSLLAGSGSSSVVLACQDSFGNQVLGVSGSVSVIINSSYVSPLSPIKVTFSPSTGTGSFLLSDSRVETLQLSLRDDYSLGVSVNNKVILYSTGAAASVIATGYTAVSPTVDFAVLITLTVVDAYNTTCNWYNNDSMTVALSSTSGNAAGSGTYTFVNGIITFSVSDTIPEVVKVTFRRSVTLNAPSAFFLSFATGAPAQFAFLPNVTYSTGLQLIVKGTASLSLQVQDQFGNPVSTSCSVTVMVNGSAVFTSSNSNSAVANFVGASLPLVQVTDTAAQLVQLSLADTRGTDLSASATATLSYGSGSCTQYSVSSINSSAYFDFTYLSSGKNGMSKWPKNTYVPFNTSQSVQVVIECLSSSKVLDTSQNTPVLTLTFSSNQTAIINGPCQMFAGVCTVYFQSYVAGYVDITVTDAYVSYGYTIPPAVSVLFNQNVPIIWSVTGQEGTTDGCTIKSQLVTFVGETFMCGQNFVTAPNITFTDLVTGLSANCPVVTFNSTFAVCALPAGQGKPQIFFSVCGVTQVDLPRWPTDAFFYVFGIQPDYCTSVYNMWDYYYHTWDDNYFCSMSTRALLDVRFYQPPVPNGHVIGSSLPASVLPYYPSVPAVVNVTHKCTAMWEFDEPWGWPSIFLCLPKLAPYDWIFTRTGVINGDSCVPIREGSDPFWAAGSHYMCTPPNTPYPDIDGVQMYYYAAPFISSISPVTANCSGNITLTLQGSSFGLPNLITNTLTVGGKSCAINALKYNFTYMECTLPPGETLFNAVVLTVENQLASNVPNFPYMPPFITSITPASGLTSGAQIITVVGYNFGFSSAVVTIGGLTCSILTYSNTNITCSTPSGTGANQAVYVTTNYQTNLVPYLWSYLAPSIITVSPSIYYSSGGAILTITGTSFGASGATTLVAGALCPQVSQNQTLIYCTLPAGQGANLTVTVIQTALISSPGSFSYAAPYILSSTPLIAASGPGVFLTLNGTSFGISGTVTVNGNICSYANGYYSHYLIQCALPLGTGADVTVVVVSANQASNAVLFSYAPVINSVVSVAGQPAYTVGGSTVIISGSGFASTSVVNDSVMVNSISTCVVHSQNDTTIICTLPAGQGTTNNIAVISQYSFSSKSIAFSYAPPVVSTITPSHATTSGGANITLVGNSFGFGNATTVSVSSTLVNLLSANHTVIVFILPAGTGASKQVLITVAGQSSNTVYFSYDAPVISANSPSGGATTGNYYEYLTGTNFGVPGSGVSPVASVGGLVVPVNSYNNTYLNITIGVGQGAVSVFVLVDSQVSNSVVFVYNPPTLSTLTPTSGPTNGGDVILSLGGSSFGSLGQVYLQTNDGTDLTTQCPLAGTGYGQNTIQCALPPGQGTNLTVYVYSGFRYSNMLNFSYNPPSINSVDPLTATTDGGTVITLRGDSFGQSGSVSIGHSPCQQAGYGTTYTDTLIMCQVQAGQGVNYSVSVTASRQTSLQEFLLSYLPPTITALLPSHGPTTGNTVITVEGTNFGSVSNVTFNGTSGSAYAVPCVQTGIGQNNQQITCIVPAGQGPNIPVFVQVSTQISLASVFSYDNPIIYSITPSAVPTDGSAILTLTGINLGTGINYTLTVGGSVISPISYNQTVITFRAPAGSGSSLPLSLDVATLLASNQASPLSYSPPTITMARCEGGSSDGAVATDCDYNGGTNLTLTGTNFGTLPSLILVQVGDNNCTNVSMVSDNTQLTCILAAQPAGGKLIAVMITVNGQAVTENDLSYGGPTIVSNTLVLYPNYTSSSTGSVIVNNPVLYPLSVVTFQGTHFGTNMGIVSITYGLPSQTNQYVCAVVNLTTVNEATNTQNVSCITSMGVGSNLTFLVHVAQMVTPRGTDTLSYPVPELVPDTMYSDTQPTPGRHFSGIRNPGDVLYFQATGVGIDSSLLTIFFAASSAGPFVTACNSVTLSLTGNVTTIGCTMPQGQGSNLVFAVQALNVLSAAGTDTYSYPTSPVVYSINGCPLQSGNTTSNCYTTGGEFVNITGDVFGETSSILSVRIGSHPCDEIVSFGDHSLGCFLEAGSGYSQPIIVTRSQLSSLPVPYLSYAAASIGSVSGCIDSYPGTSNCPRSGGTAITITGQNFGPSAPLILIGGSPCINVTADITFPNTRVYCVTPPGTALNIPLILAQTGGPVTSSSSVLLSYQACPAGTYPSSANVSCLPCPSGTFQNTPGQPSCLACAAGYIPSIDAMSCVACKAGSVSSAGNSTCTECLAGWYSPLAGSASCQQCSVGTYSNISGVEACTPCAVGSANPSTGLTACTACGSGLYIDYTGAATCVACAAGTESLTTQGASCTDCPAGTYSIAQSSSCTPCQPGYITAQARSSQCTACDSGTFSNSSGLSVCYQCQPGQFSLKSGDQGPIQCSPCVQGTYTAVASQSSCLQCSLGSYSNSLQATSCSLCQEGTYNNAPAATACTSCIAGQYSNVNGSVNCSPCEAGTYSGGPGAVICSACAAGSYQDVLGATSCKSCGAGTAIATLGQASCVACDSGTFSNNTGLPACLQCPVGQYSQKNGDQGSQTCLSCNPGTYASSEGTDVCTPCPIGYFAPQSGMSACTKCSAGSAATHTGTSSCTSCSAGSYSSIDGAFECTQCNPGTFSSDDSATTCSACTAGYFASSYGTTVCSACGNGLYSGSTGQSTCAQCQAGSYTFSGQAFTSCISCSPGSYQGMSSATSCIMCSPGQVQFASGQASCVACSAGYYQPVSNSTLCLPCVAGTAVGTSGASSCNNCQPGTYASNFGSAQCLSCPAGQYNNAVNSTSCSLCGLGYYISAAGQTTCVACTTGTYTTSTGSIQCSECAPGTYINATGAGVCLPCPAGTFASSQGSESCQLCGNGTYAATTGNLACSQCSAGSVPELNGVIGLSGSTSCQSCSPGYFLSSGGFDTCLPCAEGTYASSEGQTVCTPCYAGSYTNESSQSTCINCDTGMYQPILGSTSCLTCLPGTFAGNTGLAVCELCAAGTASNLYGLTVGCGLCPAGQYQNLLGQTVCQSCEPGEQAPTNGSKSCSPCVSGHFAGEPGSTQCLQCAPGQYQPLQGASNCSLCPIGQFSNAPGALTCLDCAIGSYSNSTGLSSCILCSPGSFSPNGGALNCSACPLGEHQSNPGATTCELCSSGHFSDVTGEQQCSSCLPGSFQSNTGSTTCLPCPEGSYQSAGSQSSCKLCPFGTFGNTTGLQSCFPCEEGYYQSQPGSTTCIACLEGNYQPTPGQSSCLLCSPGKYNNMTGVTACSDCTTGTIQTQQGAINCTLCPVGYFSTGPGLTSCSACSIGSYNAIPGSQTCLLCIAGQYQKAQGASLCNACSPGQYQSGPGATTCYSCPAGTFTQNAGESSCTACDPGHYQLATGQTSCELCPLGQFNNLPQQRQCSLCPAGQFGDSLGLTACSSCAISTAQSSLGSTSCAFCSPGTYGHVEGLTQCVNCPQGEYQPDPGASTCLSCGAGYFQNSTQSTSCYACEPGYDNPQTGQSSCYECKDGTVAIDYRTSSCTQCAPGTVQPNFGSLSCSFCQPGQYQPGEGMDTCMSCPEGQFSNFTGASACENCPEGTYQPSQGSSSCLPCSLGYFNINPRQTSCQACAQGQYSNVSGASSCSNCPTGSYGQLEAQSSCLPCGNGTFADQTQQTVCNVCDPGTISIFTYDAAYLFQMGPTQCTQCPSGTYQSASGKSLCLPCPSGEESGLGTGNIQCSPCMAGTFSLGGAASCSSCTAGSFQNLTGASFCLECPVGQFNPTLQASICQECSAGSFSNSTGLSECEECPAGYSQNVTGSTSCNSCDVGTYADLPGTHQCLSCPPGHVTDVENAATCTPCGLGQYQASPGQDHCIPCDVGEYSDGLGSQFCKSCSVGSYSTLQSGASVCSVCAPGQYQNQPGQTTCLPCSDTTFSAVYGAASCSACPQGTYGNATGQSICNECQAGTFQSNVSSSTCTLCNPGFFSGAGQPTCSVCGTGQVTDKEGTINCYACPPLLSQPNFQQTECICNAGYYMPYYTPGNNTYVCEPCPAGADCTLPGTDWTNIKSLPCYWRANNVTLNFYRCTICSYCLGGLAAGSPYSSSEDIDITGSYTDVSAWDAATPCLANRAGIMCSACDTGYQSQIGGACVPCPTGISSYILAVLLAVFFVFIILLSFWAILRSDRHLFENFDRITSTDENSLSLGDASDLSDSSSDYSSSEDDSETTGSETKPSSISRKSSSQSPSASDHESLSNQQCDSYSDTNEDTDSEQEIVNLKPTGEPRNMEVVKPIQFSGPPAPPDNFTYKLKILVGFLQISTNLSSGLDIQWPTLYKQFLQYFDVINFDSLLGSVTSSDCIGAVTYYIEFLFYVLAPIVALAALIIVYIAPSQFDLFCYRRQTLQSKIRTRMKFWKIFLYCIFLVYPSISSTVLRLFVCTNIDGTLWLATNLRVQCYTSEWWQYAFIAVPFIILYPIGIPCFFFILLFRNRKMLMERRVQAQLGFLYASYQRQLWWFEILDSINKLFLTSILAFFPSQLQLPIGMAAVTVYSMIILILQPFLSPSDDILQLLALTEIFLLCLAGWIYYNLPYDTFSGTQDSFVSACLIIITVLFFICFLLAFIWAFRQLVTNCLAKHLTVRRKENEAKQFEEDQERLRRKLAEIENTNTAKLRFEFILDGIGKVAQQTSMKLMDEEKEIDNSYSISSSDDNSQTSSDEPSESEGDHQHHAPSANSPRISANTPPLSRVIRTEGWSSQTTPRQLNDMSQRLSVHESVASPEANAASASKSSDMDQRLSIQLQQEPATSIIDQGPNCTLLPVVRTQTIALAPVRTRAILPAAMADASAFKKESDSSVRGSIASGTRKSIVSNRASLILPPLDGVLEPSPSSLGQAKKKKRKVIRAGDNFAVNDAALGHRASAFQTFFSPNIS